MKMGTLALVCAAIMLTGACATPEQRAERLAAEEAKRAEQQRQWEESIRAYIENSCAYAKADPMRYGDCRRQTIQFLVQQQSQQLQAMQQQSAADARVNQMLIQSMQPKRPVQTDCYRTYNGGMSCQSQ